VNGESHEPSVLHELGAVSRRSARLGVAQVALYILDQLLELSYALAIVVGVIPIVFIVIPAASLLLIPIFVAVFLTGASPILIPLVWVSAICVGAFFALRWWVRLVGRRAEELARRVHDDAAAALMPPVEVVADRAMDHGPLSPSPSLAELDARLAPAPPTDPTSV
jgi:hypothetical protein